MGKRCDKEPVLLKKSWDKEPLAVAANAEMKRKDDPFFVQKEHVN